MKARLKLLLWLVIAIGGLSAVTAQDAGKPPAPPPAATAPIAIPQNLQLALENLQLKADNARLEYDNALLRINDADKQVREMLKVPAGFVRVGVERYEPPPAKKEKP